MKVTVLSVDGSHVSINDMDQDTVMPMIDALSDDNVSVLAVNVDDAMVYLMKRNIIRVDVD